jgi:uncharacterized protein
MVAAGLIIDLLFRALGLVPTHRNASVIEASITLNYTTVLNIVFLILAAVLVWRFMKTGGPEMLRMMGESADHSDHMGHEGHEHHSH